jgi:ketosteroid isomerase-like protein
MSQQNVEIARRAYDAYNRRDIDAMLALATSDCVMISQLLDASAEFHGREGLARYYAMLNESWEEFRSVIEEAHDLGDHVLTLNRSTARGKGSGMDVDAPTAAVFDFRDGKISRVRLYLDRAEASLEAGLIE